MVLCCCSRDMYQELELLKRFGPSLPESHPAILSEELQVLQKEKSQWLFENCLSFTCKWSSLIPCWTLYTSTEEVIYTFSMCLGVKTKVEMSLQSVFWCINKNIHLRRSWCSRQRQSCSHGLLFCSRRFPENQVIKNCCLYLFLNLCVHEEDSQLLSISFHYKRLNMTKVEQTTFEAIFKASPESRYECHWCASPSPLAMRSRLRRLARGLAPVQFVYETRL